MSLTINGKEIIRPWMAISDFFQATEVPSYIADGSIDSISVQNSIISICKVIIDSNENLNDRIINGQDTSV